MLDMVTPWLTSAVENNLGNRYRVAVGGTQIERDAQGRTSLRLRDIVLRDLSGASVAVAPKAEVWLSGASLLFGTPRVESLKLVDANMVVRIDPDGQTNIFIGGQRPFSVMAAVQDGSSQSNLQTSTIDRSRPGVPASAAGQLAQSVPASPNIANIAGLLAWIDRLNGSGLNGQSASVTEA
jgi:hypothetical protein